MEPAGFAGRVGGGMEIEGHCDTGDVLRAADYTPDAPVCPAGLMDCRPDRSAEERVCVYRLRGPDLFAQASVSGADPVSRGGTL